MKNWTLDEIIKKLQAIKAKGWIASRRGHDTGIGKTLEDELGLKENNIALPDFGKMELKSQREKTISKLTLFTKSPEGITNSRLRELYGYPDTDYPKIKCLRIQISNSNNNQGFRLEIDEDRMWLVHKNKKVGYYPLEFIKRKMKEKIGNGLILVLADSKKIKDIEYFHYNKAYLLKDIDLTKLVENYVYDIRLGIYKSGKLAGKLHDHGSAFRLSQKTIPDLFEEKITLLS